MKSSFSHIYIYVSDIKRSIKFYTELLEYFEFKLIYQDKKFFGMTNGSFDLWLEETPSGFDKDAKFHRKNTGVNHFALTLASKSDIDVFSNEFLKEKKISTLYNSPKEFPQYSKDYYGVYFEDPDRLKIEVFYA